MSDFTQKKSRYYISLPLRAETKLPPYGLGLKGRGTRKEGGFQLPAWVHLELNSSETQMSERGINGHLLPGLILRSLLSVEEERSPLFLTTYLAEMSLLPL